MNFDQARILDSKYVFQTYKRLPILLVRGRGAYVYDDTGKRYLDFLSGLAVNSLGHAHPRIAKAIAQQARTLNHVSNLYYTEPMLHLAQSLCELSGLGKAFFCNSGAEANEGAIKLARKYFSLKGEKRHEIISMKMSFHGRTMATLTATGQPFYQQHYDPLVPGFQYAELNDIASVEKLVTKKTAAILVEPVQGEGGIYPASKAFMKNLAGLRRRHGLLLMFDEVQCGLGRTGKWFAFQHHGVKPDIMTLAKPLGGGLPLGALLATNKIASGFTPGSHASTFGANPVVCAAANEFIKIVQEQNLLAHALEMGDYLKHGLRDIAQQTGRITDIRGMGLMMAVEIDKGAPGALAFLQEHGVLVNAIRDTVIRLLPPLIIQKTHADMFLKLFRQYLVESK
jgi:predicted acetylornithine/succinylornithine family transaminase